MGVGDYAGHPFRGNQWTSGGTAMSRGDWRAREETFGPYVDPGPAATSEDIILAERSLGRRLQDVRREPNRDMAQRQHLGMVADFFPNAPDSVKRVLVFYQSELPSRAAAETEGRSITLTAAAFRGEGTSGSLGATFVHEVEHVIDEKMGVKRTEFTPRLRQLIRDVPEKELQLYRTRLGRDHAEYRVNSFFIEHGHELTPADRERAVSALMAHARKREK